jgi:hypothetical protein
VFVKRHSPSSYRRANLIKGKSINDNVGTKCVRFILFTLDIFIFQESQYPRLFQATFTLNRI